MNPIQRLYVLDTNVLAHDPGAITRFDEHDVFLPLSVLEELDSIKGGSSDIAHNVRHVSRMLDDIIGDAGIASIQAGLSIPGVGTRGRLYLQTQLPPPAKDAPYAADKPDNHVLASAIHLATELTDREVVLVTRDINLRVKARAVGLTSEDYHTDRVVDDLSLLPSGMLQAPAELLRDVCIKDVTPMSQARMYPQLGLYAPGHPQLDCLLETTSATAIRARRATNFRMDAGRSVFGVHARNTEQNFALNLLMDPNVDLVTLLGVAGTGKTLLALAAGLAQTLDESRFKEIVVTRATIPVGEDIGFLPGTEEEKMTPWMGALMDNLEVLVDTDSAGSWGRAATQDLVNQRIKLRSMSFMRGRTFLNRFVIIDEAQNLTRAQMKTLLTRAGPGSKMVCVGNVEQIDTPYITETTSGLTFTVDRFTDWPHAGHVTLTRGERSRLADQAANLL